MKAFRERNPVVVGTAGLAALAALLVAAFYAEELPVIGGGTDYHAAFGDASGLNTGDEVRVAGVKVGTVRGIALDGPEVRVDFRITADDIRLGNRTAASIRIKSVFGQKYLSLEPAGSDRMAEGDRIPLDRTVTPLDVQGALGGLANTLDQIDTTQLATAFDTIAGTFRDSPAEVRVSLEGLSRLSTTIAARDAKLSALLGRTRTVTDVLAERDTAFRRLVADGNLLLTEIRNRREAIHTLLVSTTQLADQLTGLVAENRHELEPALKELRKVVAILEENQVQLDESLPLMARLLVSSINAAGTGRWFEGYVACLALPGVSAGDLRVTSCDPSDPQDPFLPGGGK